MTATFGNCKIDASSVDKKFHLLINLSLDSVKVSDLQFSFKGYVREKKDTAIEISMLPELKSIEDFTLPFICETFQLDKKKLERVMTPPPGQSLQYLIITPFLTKDSN